MKPSEMRNLPLSDFDKEIADRKKELMELRFQASISNLSKPHRVSVLRREVAQLNTIRSERQREEKA